MATMFYKVFIFHFVIHFDNKLFSFYNKNHEEMTWHNADNDDVIKHTQNFHEQVKIAQDIYNPKYTM